MESIIVPENKEMLKNKRTGACQRAWKSSSSQEAKLDNVNQTEKSEI